MILAARFRDVPSPSGGGLPPTTRLDLSDVGFLEREAVPLIVHAARQAHTHGGRLRLADRACRDRGRTTGA
ncbi:MAG TPA: hypothetical protein VHF91_01175 [Acidimicrobiales bacterium]|nr:hypothetical protein [Acidimicrobiales bacterium]